MHPLQLTRRFMAITTATKDNAAFTSLVIDTAHLRYGEFHIDIVSNDIEPAVFKIMESDQLTNDTTLGGTPTLVTDLASIIPGTAASPSGPAQVIVGIDFAHKSRKRYLQMQVTAGNGDTGMVMGATFLGAPEGNMSSDLADRQGACAATTSAKPLVAVAYV